MPAFYDIPLDLPHAGTIALRIRRFIQERTIARAEEFETIRVKAEALVELLIATNVSGENPPEPRATQLRDEAAGIARELVDLIERFDLRHDRLGQFVRNLFECLELGEEGVEISLRAGEDPNSIQRPI